MNDDPYEGFVRMGADDWPVPVADVWPPGALRASAMDAYDTLARAGEIAPQGAYRRSDGMVVVRYRAQIPEEWIHELLKRAERKAFGPVRI